MLNFGLLGIIEKSIAKTPGFRMIPKSPKIHGQNPGVCLDNRAFIASVNSIPDGSKDFFIKETGIIWISHSALQLHPYYFQMDRYF
jgi:hypothetical protein